MRHATLSSERPRSASAARRYTEALALLPDDKSAPVCDILAERCEAYLSAQRYTQACADASKLCLKAPASDKARIHHRFRWKPVHGPR